MRPKQLLQLKFKASLVIIVVIIIFQLAPTWRKAENVHTLPPDEVDKSSFPAVLKTTRKTLTWFIFRDLPPLPWKISVRSDVAHKNKKFLNPELVRVNVCTKAQHVRLL